MAIWSSQMVRGFQCFSSDMTTPVRRRVLDGSTDFDGTGCADEMLFERTFCVMGDPFCLGGMTAGGVLVGEKQIEAPLLQANEVGGGDNIAITRTRQRYLKPVSDTARAGRQHA